ncbi:MAG: heme-binding protein [Candidatus Saccharibacteria bacterium]|nr:heme-binding protein [Pseudorhodobacter sp.]
MDIAGLEAEAGRLILPRFDEGTAVQLGLILVDLARGLPVVINIRDAGRTFFHAALPGSQANNDNWARRKSNLALLMGRASMLVRLQYIERQRTLAVDGLNGADHADHGGAVPVVVAGVGMVAVCTVSGLPQEEDHALVIRGLAALLIALS